MVNVSSHSVERACVREAGLCVSKVAHVAIGDDRDAERRLHRLQMV